MTSPPVRGPCWRLRRPRLRSVLGAFSVVSMMWYAAGVGLAQGTAVPLRAVKAALVNGAVQVGFDATHFAGPTVVDKLKSGLPQTLVTRVSLHPSGAAKPIAFTAQSCRVIYDLWQGTYRVQLDRPGRTIDLTVPSVERVVQRCLEVRGLPLTGASLASLRGKRLFFAVVVELNPLSQATVQRIRRWLSRPAGGQLGGDAFFGSFVSIFVGREIGAAEKALSFRSRPWNVPE